jgi:hypothetical protein
VVGKVFDTTPDNTAAPTFPSTLSVLFANKFVALKLSRAVANEIKR